MSVVNIRDKFLIFDGAMGTMLQKYGLKAGELPELLNLTDPETVLKIHREYVAAGSDVITANTFGANRKKLGSAVSPETVISAGIKLAKKSGAKYVALDIGPIGALLKPLGTLSFEEAYDIFKQEVIAGVKAGADIILIETMSDLSEIKAAILAAKENSSLPVFATMTFAEDGRTFLGTSPEIAAVNMSGLGADAVGVNCSLGPKDLVPIVRKIAEYTDLPIMVQANAGLPKIENGKTVYEITPSEYAESVELMIQAGVSVIGGCCGTDPDYIREIRKLTASRSPIKREVKKRTVFTSAQNLVELDGTVAVVGERINPTGKKKLKAALREKNYSYILSEAISQQEHGADILDVNAGLPEIDEVETLKALIGEIQAVTPLPLQIGSSSPEAIEQAARIYCGKPLINSVNGKEENMKAIFPIVSKYGAAVIGLTLDENGIPETAQGRLEIARKIVDTAAEYGISREDIIIDCLVLTASTSQEIVCETLKAVSLVKEHLGVKTVLGVSNVSFGLPNRELINSTFLAAAFGAGLDMPILNPLSEKYMQVADTFKVLNAQDKKAEAFINKYANTAPAAQESFQTSDLDIGKIIISGRKSAAKEATEALLKTKTPMEIIDGEFIPALDIVGDKFEKGEIFLPQLMSSAEAVKVGFEVLKSLNDSSVADEKGTILLATVKGDIHDIGKNIVKMLLENYGYNIIDLGKDVDPRLVADTVKEKNIGLVGLSALMTTTVENMAETIKILRAECPNCKIMVGGAVLNEEYAELVGADYYCKDANESARIAASFFESKAR